MSRKNAREYAFKVIFEYLFEKSDNTPTLDAFLSDNSLTEKDKEYLKSVVFSVRENFDELYDLIAAYAKGFNADRIFKPDLAAMLLSCAEMKYIEDVPASVSINECVELVKNYSTEKSSGYVNGVLANIYKHLKGDID